MMATNACPAMVFIDVETTGFSPTNCRIIEIAAIRVQDGIITDEVNTLIDPECEIPEHITTITGIEAKDLKGEPKFVDVIAELDAVLADAMFVAHNARFDYDFIREEYNREREVLDVDDIYCTKELSKLFYPDEKGHKLQDLIQRHDIKVSARHRAYDDALALHQFVEFMKKRFGEGLVMRALEDQRRK